MSNWCVSLTCTSDSESTVHTFFLPGGELVSSTYKKFRIRKISKHTAFQPDGPGLIPVGFTNFHLYPGTECMSFVCILSCVVCGGSRDNLLTVDLREVRHCVSVKCPDRKSVLPYRHLSHAHLGCKFRGWMNEWMKETNRIQSTAVLAATRFIRPQNNLRARVPRLSPFVPP